MNKSNLFKGLTLTIILMVISAGTVSSHGFRSNYSIPEGMNLEQYDLKEGNYTGTADGFRPGLEVEVEIKNGKLVSVEVVDHNEIGRQYYQTPIRVIPGSIVGEQNTDVDVVSGATATSKAIMAAVEDAVQKAEK